MPTAESAFEALTTAGLTFWTGVPDSLLKPLCAYVLDHVPDDHHVIAANEGGAVAVAVGHYLGSGNPAAVYLQNSGLGNAMNPLVSLADPAVYSIPMVLIIGWRGEPGRHDEPQHLAQGGVTLEMLEAIGVPHAVAPSEDAAFASVAHDAVQRAVADSRPVAIVVPKGTITDYTSTATPHEGRPLTREEAVVLVADGVQPDAVIVATTGKTSRELYEHRMRSGHGTERDFLMVGSMGHASQIALGLALAHPARPVWVLDGDGAVVMHMGSLAVIGEHAPDNLRHVVLNNQVHDSVGGQPTPTQRADFARIARAAGYVHTETASDGSSLADAVERIANTAGPALLEVRVQPGARSDLGRPETSPVHNKRTLMQWLAQ